jgi:hypothetical protein
MDKTVILKKIGLPASDCETIEHDMAIKRFFAIKNNEKLTEEFSNAMFYKGITGEYVRGRQTLMSYIYMKHLPNHTFEGKDIFDICGIPKLEQIDKTDVLLSYYCGAVWNELPLRYLVELEDIIKKDKPNVTETDKKFLDNVVACIANANDEETPGKLEKRMASNKVLPKTTKYSRYGILQTLAECGILPNDYILPKYEGFVTFKEIIEKHTGLKGSARSDIILPLAGWRGRNGTNNKKYEEIFR